MERRTLLKRAGIACATIAAAGCAGPGGGNETGNDTGGDVGANDSASVGDGN